MQHEKMTLDKAVKQVKASELVKQHQQILKGAEGSGEAKIAEFNEYKFVAHRQKKFQRGNKPARGTPKSSAQKRHHPMIEVCERPFWRNVINVIASDIFRICAPVLNQ